MKSRSSFPRDRFRVGGAAITPRGCGPGCTHWSAQIKSAPVYIRALVPKTTQLSMLPLKAAQAGIMVLGKGLGSTTAIFTSWCFLQKTAAFQEGLDEGHPEERWTNLLRLSWIEGSNLCRLAVSACQQKEYSKVAADALLLKHDWRPTFSKTSV